MPIEITISTPLPAGAQPSLVPNLTTTFYYYYYYYHYYHYYFASPSSSSDDDNDSSDSNPNVAPVDEPHTFQVTDRRPTGQTTYRLTLTNRAEGIDSAVDGKAPTGSIAIRARWRVVLPPLPAGDAGLLEEHVDIESNMITRKMVKSSIERSHPEYHRTFLAEAAKAS
ncbi:hypothetical protein GL218_02159 [Daldinia childiae]|uniref:uncharacterized protein n=1 Tax=Daldinia childiae TaxID=326645 RepID=UPI0014477732|nr:uncharacterized protein GL218_02159 [Daldinia childiae]KAF3064040.1 hypothetical protein GL218_02159 [Daldinia childiae]